MNAQVLLWLGSGLFVGFCVGFMLAAVMAQAKIDEFVNMPAGEGERVA